MEEADRSDIAAILVVDDELGIRQGVERTLRSQGHRVDTAEDAAIALRQIEKASYDLILLDVMMPGGSGIDLIAPIHAKDPDTVCIIITGFATVELAVDAIKRGAYDFISKPFTADQLIVAVNQGLERRRLARDARRLAVIEAEARGLAEAKAELEKLDRVKSELMLRVAHELRAPTAAVQSYVNLIQAGYVPADELRPTLDRIQDRLRQTLDLVSDLLDLAQLKQTRDTLALRASPQPMAEIVREVVGLFEQQAREKGLVLRLETTVEPRVTARREHMRQVWTNLISNAVKYTPRGGHIDVALNSTGGNLTGIVEDTGIGIAEADLPKLFQDFFRTDQAKASGEVGTGLGLSIVREIIESYGGRIRVQSVLGGGTRFEFSLPITSTQTAAEAPT